VSLGVTKCDYGTRADVFPGPDLAVGVSPARSQVIGIAKGRIAEDIIRRDEASTSTAKRAPILAERHS
jgi:hypothetical protein